MMSMKIDQAWEWDDFHGEDFSHHSPRELYEQMCSISEGITAGRKEIEKKMEAITANTKYAALIEKRTQKGIVEDWIQEPLKLFRIAEEGLKEVLKGIQKDGVQKNHTRRLLHIGKVAAKDFSIWAMQVQPPKIGNADMQEAMFDLGRDIGALLSGPKALEKIGIQLQALLDSRIPLPRVEQIDGNWLEVGDFRFRRIPELTISIGDGQNERQFEFNPKPRHKLNQADKDRRKALRIIELFAPSSGSGTRRYSSKKHLADRFKPRIGQRTVDSYLSITNALLRSIGSNYFISTKEGALEEEIALVAH